MKKLILASAALGLAAAAALPASADSLQIKNNDVHIGNKITNTTTNNTTTNNTTINNAPFSDLSGLNGSISGSYAKFKSSHGGNALNNGATNKGKLTGEASYGGLSQVGTKTQTDVVRDRYGDVVKLQDGSAQTISNPVNCNCMTGFSGSQVAGSAKLETQMGNVSGYNAANSWSGGEATGFSVGGSLSSAGSL
ncbi:MAG TPA: hypothetical protein VGU45_17815 [Microvirga sp.]|nr:hypothetical protein [Microvirga sp.]